MSQLHTRAIREGIIYHFKEIEQFSYYLSIRIALPVMKEVKISKTTPREEGSFSEIRVSKGIEKYYLLSAGLMFLGVLAIGSSFLPPYEMGLIIFKCGAGLGLIVGGAIMYGINAIRVKGRKHALRNGAIITGKVIDHGRKFNPTNSNRYYTVTIKYHDGHGDDQAEIKSSDKEIFKFLPLESETLGILADLPQYKVFFPAEVGVKLIIE